jgi:ribonucleoside-diphosphate reductase alpha chain
MKMPLAEHIWATRYRSARRGDVIDASFGDTAARVARAVASVEREADSWFERYKKLIAEMQFLPGGRVLAGAGTDKQVTLFNCFVSGPVEDSIDGILSSLKEAALTMQQGGGIGVDFSALRPAGIPAARTGVIASGPVSFMHIWDALCETMLATSSRRGAMIGTLRCDHPDILEFIDAKRRPGELKNFNLSVLISDDFMAAVRGDETWSLTHPAGSKVHERVSARLLWQRIVEAAHATAEPGLLFVDKINRENNLYYCERIHATNPCGEVPLPPYGACNLGSINLVAFVVAPFSGHAELNEAALSLTVSRAVRFLDAVIDVSGFPLTQQAAQARSARRIGLGVTGLADALAMLGLHYDSDAARAFAARTLTRIRDTAYEASVALAREKGVFPLFDPERHLEAPFIRSLPDRLREAIAASGIRNSHLLAIAPAGTISLLAGNLSSGIEPIYALEAERTVLGEGQRVEHFQVRDYAYDRWLDFAKVAGRIPDAFVTADQLPARAHLDMQASLQPLVDNAISKTVNLQPEATTDDVAEAFMYAYASSIKGCTVYRPGSRAGQVLKACSELHCGDAI